MRGSFFAQALCGAASVTALAVPGQVEERAELVDLSIFKPHPFPLTTPEEAAAMAGIDSAGSTSTTARPLNSPHINAASSCTNPAVRYEWRDLSAVHKTQYISASKCLLGKPSKSGLQGAKNRYEDLQAVHQHMTKTIHGVGQFLPWHRYFMHAHESLLRTECGYTGPMTWWDETKDAGHFSTAPMFTSAYFGSAPVKTSSGQGTCVTNGAFANTELYIGPGQTVNSKHCLSRAVNEGLSKDITMNFVKSCNSHDNYTDMWKCSYTGPHAYGHDAVGAVMSDVDTSPGDPIFFLHHGFIDRNWRIWQNANPSQRLFQINGYTTQTKPAGGWQDTTLNYVLSSMNIIPNAVINNVMNTEGGYLCYKYNY